MKHHWAVAVANLVVQERELTWFSWLSVGIMIAVAFLIITVMLALRHSDMYMRPARAARARIVRAEDGSSDPDLDPVVIPHKATPKIATISGLLAILSLSATMALITNFTEATAGLTIVYVAVAVLGITSFGLGVLVLKTRLKVLNSLRSEWKRLPDFSARAVVSNQLRRRIAEQRDALLISGDLADAYRAGEILRSLPERGPGFR